ncbi:hypothetical protein FOZ63_008355 [Perkinsus olseni]|uniref:Uncharacterized protein n=1 Tax=Perkinsus olseni TaxID=32597 RepID=A0A7J6RDC5_PEROL|nr:hypothetical protein FOZ60_017057 [Perkinsus olseni]KAF4718738.1 hypothetical protein FOZ63_008355 [Perkinsus olseni]
MTVHYDDVLNRRFTVPVNDSSWVPLSKLNDAAFRADRKSVFWAAKGRNVARYRSSGSSLIGQPKEKSTSADDRVLDLIPKVCSAVLDTIKKEYGTKFKDLCAQYHGVTLTALTEDWLSMDLA